MYAQWFLKKLAIAWCSLPLNTRGGVLEDVLGLEEVLEDTFWRPWPWPWPRSLKSSKIAPSSSRGQHYFWNRWNFVEKRLKPRGKFANTFFVFLNWSIGVAKRGGGGTREPTPPIKISPMTKMCQKSLPFLQFQFLFSIFLFATVSNNNMEDQGLRAPFNSIFPANLNIQPGRNGEFFS